jgi:N-acetylmuramoyl-L-alanine amidase
VIQTVVIRRLAIGVPAVAATIALLFVPLPQGCDPRTDELPPDRYGELARFDGARTRAEIEADLRLVDPHGALAPYLILTDKQLAVRLVPGDRTAVVWVGLRPPDQAAPPTPRRYRRVAVDPGHFGGAWAQAEKRHHSRDGGPTVREGDLTWATAGLLARRLRDAGGEVRLLRGPPPTAAFARDADPTFDPDREAGFWMAINRDPGHDPPWLAPWWAVGLWRQRRQLADDSRYDLFVQHDLRRRAAEAAAFAPDVTVSLHFNYTLEDRNGVLVFVPGNFLPGELITPSQRFWALRHVLDGTLADNVRLASAMGAALKRHFALPALRPSGHELTEPPTWLPVDPDNGVYARNLGVLRRAPGVSLLLEGPCLNQTDEYPRMLGTELEIDGRRYPARLRQYADAVIEALQVPAPAPR